MSYTQIINDDNLLNGKVDVTLNNKVGDDDSEIYSISDAKIIHHDETKESTKSNKDQQLDQLLQHIYDNFVKKADHPPQSGKSWCIIRYYCLFYL